jgi:hypothetical protein
MAETLAVTWHEPSPALLAPVRGGPAAGAAVDAGDTLFMRTDRLERLEMERLGMELAFMEASLSRGDSTVLAARDSISAALEHLDGMVPWTSPSPGRLVFVADSGYVDYGDTLATIVIPPDSVFTLVAPPGAVVHSWPDSAAGSRLIEEADGRAVYSGVAGGDAFVFPESWTVPRQALYERGLGHYLITAGGDTVTVTRFATAPGGIVVIAPGAALGGTELVLWAATGD